MEAKLLETRMSTRPRPLIWLPATILGVAVALLLARPALALPYGSGSSPLDGATSYSAPCLECHGNPTFSTELPSGERVSLFVDEAEMEMSVHGGKLACTDCHRDVTDLPHDGLRVEDRREFSMALYEACKRCHFANYTKTLDSMHYQVLESGNREAPLCTDCHGYHNVSDPDQPRSKISQSCASCHEDTYNTYAESVHGAAMARDENNTDVPVCTDCHGTHIIKDASSASFHLESPEMCARCHADGDLMSRYGLSPQVFKTYVQDFHGSTVALTRHEGTDNWTDKAVCSDCHGVHDIKPVRGGDPAEIKQNMVKTCQKCHPDAGTNFPDIWLSHHELSRDKAPLPWLVRASYTILIPLMAGGLLLHVVVDLWRVARNR